MSENAPEIYEDISQMWSEFMFIESRLMSLESGLKLLVLILSALFNEENISKTSFMKLPFPLAPGYFSS